MPLDRRTLGMAAALAGIWVALDLATGGLFLTARNLVNLAVQSAVVGILASGMVLVIVARHIDLSVGSVLGVTGMAIALAQAEWLPGEAAWSWPASLALGLGLGAGIGAWQGFWVAYRGVPSFVVTLAGLLVFRGGAWLLAGGRTVAPLAPRHAALGGGPDGSLGAAASWLLAVVATALLVGARLRRRARRRAVGIPVPTPAREGLGLALAAAPVLGFVALTTALAHPATGAPLGVPIPVLVVVAVAAATSVLARRTRFGRHVFAIGGSPEAAALAGIDVRRTTLGVFVWMGVLAALAGAVTTARLDAGTNSMGTLAELSAIAAAVLGGTSLAGGSGSVGAALLGAVVMQSLESGLVLLGVSSPLRQVWIGLVLIAAVWLDVAVRRRA